MESRNCWYIREIVKLWESQDVWSLDHNLTLFDEMFYFFSSIYDISWHVCLATVGRTQLTLHAFFIYLLNHVNLNQ
jgi:hypothetical protein